MQKSNLKSKAIISLILGVISGGLMIILGVLLMLSNKISFLQSIFIAISLTTTPLIVFIGYVIVPLAAIIGVIFGIQGLKSTKRNFAIAGIVLCLIGLLIPLYYFLK